MRECVPAKISSGYLARHRGLDASQILSWVFAHPDWPDRLKVTIAKPALFTMTVDTISDAIANRQALI